MTIQPRAGECRRAEFGGVQLTRGKTLHHSRVIRGGKQFDRNTQFRVQQTLKSVIALQAILRVLASQKSDAEFLDLRSPVLADRRTGEKHRSESKTRNAAT